MPNIHFSNLTPDWNRDSALRTDYARRQALVGIDVLASMALGLPMDELKTIYRVQFPVLRQNENDTWYDRKGRIVFTCSKGLTGVGFSHPEWNEIKDMESGTIERSITDDTLPSGPRKRTIVYEAPFDKCAGSSRRLEGRRRSQRPFFVREKALAIIRKWTRML